MDSQRKSWPKRTEARVTNEQTKEGTNTSSVLLKFIYQYTVFCPGFQKGRVPSEKGTLARWTGRQKGTLAWWKDRQKGTLARWTDRQKGTLAQWTEEKGHN